MRHYAARLMLCQDVGGVIQYQEVVTMSKIQVQGVHHITFVGSNRDTIIDFYEGVLGMPLIMDQPNLDVPDETHLYFDAGDYAIEDRHLADALQMLVESKSVSLTASGVK